MALCSRAIAIAKEIDIAIAGRAIRMITQERVRVVEALVADFQQLDFKRQCAVRRNRAYAAIAVCGCRRAHELGLAAHLHLLKALRPARDYLAERKRCRLSTLVRGVEFGAVRERAAIVDGHGVGRGRLRPGAFLDLRHGDAGGKRFSRARSSISR